MRVTMQPNRRTLNRVVFDKNDRIAVKLYYNNTNGQPQELEIHQVADLNGEGLSILVDEHTEYLKQAEIQKIDILLQDRQIGTKNIDKRINHGTNKTGGKYPSKISFIFDKKETNRSYYFPPDKLKRVKKGLFKFTDSGNTKEILRSILGSGTRYRDNRKSKRLRLALSDDLTVFLFFQRITEPIKVDLVADISPSGVACYMPSIDMFNISKGRMEKVVLAYKDDTLAEKKVKKFGITQTEIDGQLLFKICIEFDQEVKACLPIDGYLNHEDGMARLTDKSVLAKLVQAMVSTSSDVQVAVAVDEQIKNKIYQLRYETYMAERKINKTDYPDGILRDTYDEKSLLLYIHIHRHIIASARITFDTMCEKLDVENFYTKMPLRQAGLKYIEVSRFCIDNLFRNNINKSMNIVLKLFLEAYRISLIQRVDRCLITAYKPHINLYKSIGFVPVSGFIKIPNFNFEYVVMSWDLNYNKVGKILRPFFIQVWHDAQSLIVAQPRQSFIDLNSYQINKGCTSNNLG